MLTCSKCGTQYSQASGFCSVCGTALASHHEPQVLPPESQVLSPNLPFPAGSPPHHLASRSFAQIFGLHPAVAFVTIAVDLMLNLGEGLTWGALWIATIPIGLVIGIIAYMAQKKWYGDDNESAIIKALIVALLTAIPVPLSPILIPSGIMGFFNRKK